MTETPPPRPPMFSPLVIDAVIIIVATVWAASMILQAFLKSYDPPPGLTEIFLLTVGTLLGVRHVNGGTKA